MLCCIACQPILFYHNIGSTARCGSYEQRLAYDGILLRSKNRTVFLTAFRIPSPTNVRIKKRIASNIQSFGLQLLVMGFSHGLKTVHRTVFLTAFRIPSPTNTHIKKRVAEATLFFMGWEMGFEPTNAGTTIRCLRPLGDTHHIRFAECLRMARQSDLV